MTQTRSSRGWGIALISYVRGRRASSLWLALALLAACGCPDDELPLAVIGVASSLEVCAEVADTEEERRQGLMGHAPLGPGEGMYFDFPVEQEICFYNAGVDFSIDILFADTDGTVVAIERRVPAGDTTLRCQGATKLALEVAAGALDDHAIGDALRVR
ncbi:MAG: DUF192 domain-containing protein [Sandaracinaceae bacterium]